MNSKIFLVFPFIGKTMVCEAYPKSIINGDIEFEKYLASKNHKEGNDLSKALIEWLNLVNDKKILLLNASSEYINILNDNNISYTLVFPEESLKSVYIDKIKDFITEEELNEFEKTFTDNVLRLKQDTKNVHIILSNPEDTIEGVLKEFNILNEN